MKPALRRSDAQMRFVATLRKLGRRHLVKTSPEQKAARSAVGHPFYGHPKTEKKL
jgi:hypothetical protein